LIADFKAQISKSLPLIVPDAQIVKLCRFFIVLLRPRRHLKIDVYDEVAADHVFVVVQQVSDDEMLGKPVV
ncbi:MAG: hypothetical protein LBT62_02865, partial [Deltaproteobacteria bacterium]|jgi:hypothetical protein|nr:hypothetical protein [Deltaproteobacteria bacterium]